MVFTLLKRSHCWLQYKRKKVDVHSGIWVTSGIWLIKINKKLKVKIPASLMIWDCMSAILYWICIIPKQESARVHCLLFKVTKHLYLYIFQDSLKCHTAWTTKAWLLPKSIPTMELPSNSPDLWQMLLVTSHCKVSQRSLATTRNCKIPRDAFLA